MDEDKLKKYQEAWEDIDQWGFADVDTVPYFVVVTCCERAGLDRDDIDLDEFQKIFECKVG